MAHGLVLLVLLISLSEGRAQNAYLDSLKQAWPNQTGADQVKTLCDLCWELGFQNPQEAADYGKRALTVATEIGDSSLVSQAANDLSAVIFRLGDYRLALALNRRALAIRKIEGNPRSIGSSLSKIGLILYEQTLLDSAATYQLEALRMFEKAGDSIAIGQTYSNLSNVFEKFQSFDAAIDYSLKSYNLFQKIKFPYGEAGACGNLATLYEKTGDYSQSVIWSERALALFTAIDSKIDIANMHNNLGYYARKQGKLEEGRKHYAEALAISEENGDEAGIAQFLANLASISVDLKEFDKAESDYRRALEIARKADLNPVVKQCYEGISNALAGKGKWKESLDYHKRFVVLKDSLFSEDKFRIVNELQTQYETEKREKELAEERAENAEKDREIERQRTTNIMLFGGIGMIILLGGALISRQRQVQKAKLSEAEVIYQQELVKERERGLEAVFSGIEDERQRIAKDLHDGVGQQLSGIKLSLSRLISEIPSEQKPKLDTLSEVVDNVANDVRSLSHQMMPKALQELGLVAAIGDMLEKSLGLGEIKYDFEHFNADKRYSKRVEIGLYRICQELVNNIIKHSRATHAVVQLFENKSTLILMVEDNGQGFDPASKKDGIGLMNIESRLNTVSGEVNWQPSPDSGTVATVRIPITAA